jgi:hypothetical protein
MSSTWLLCSSRSSRIAVARISSPPRPRASPGSPRSHRNARLCTSCRARWSVRGDHTRAPKRLCDSRRWNWCPYTARPRSTVSATKWADVTAQSKHVTRRWSRERQFLEPSPVGLGFVVGCRLPSRPDRRWAVPTSPGLATTVTVGTARRAHNPTSTWGPVSPRARRPLLALRT